MRGRHRGIARFAFRSLHSLRSWHGGPGPVVDPNRMVIRFSQHEGPKFFSAKVGDPKHKMVPGLVHRCSLSETASHQSHVFCLEGIIASHQSLDICMTCRQKTFETTTLAT